MIKKSRPTPKRRMRHVIASRDLTDAKDPETRIIVSMSIPRKVSHLEWRCNVRIDGLSQEPFLDHASGVDSLQALLMGVEVLRQALKRSPHRLAWLGNSVRFPAGGIPRQVSGNLGDEFDERMEQLIKREEKPFWKSGLADLRARHLESKKRRTSSSQKPSRGRRRSD